MSDPLRIRIGHNGDDFVKNKKTVIITCTDQLQIILKVAGGAFKHEDQPSNIGTLLHDVANDLLSGNYIVDPQ